MSPFQHETHDKKQRQTRRAEYRRVAPAEMGGLVGQHHHRRRWRNVRHGSRGFGDGGQVLRAFGALPAHFAHFRGIERLRMPFVATGQYVHRIAFAGAVHPETHAAVPAARADAAGIARRVVHTDTSDAKSAFRHAHAFGFVPALTASYWRLALAVAAPEDFFHAGAFAGVDVGILRRKPPKKQGQQKAKKKKAFH